MSAQSDAIVSEARRWLGTPYRHQASACGQGADCLGLLRGIWRKVIGPEPESLPSYSPDWSEPSGQERLWQAALRHMEPQAVNPDQVGQVLLFRMRNASVAKHVGILADQGFATIIHAYSGQGVVETPLSPAWQRRIVAQFSFPDRS